ncbi:MAG: cyclase family protein [Spirochaetaceae bacterium]|jgi:kynurenine formamidase|nr:cyclase family protein [Spirochaetaceae bacterium]
MYTLISYPITENVPAWHGSPQTTIERRSRIECGDAANTCLITLFNHIGTHYDAPNHFIAGGLRISQLDLERFIFEHPLLLDIPKSFCEKIYAEDLVPHAAAIARADLLMLRTGFSRYRTEAPSRYEREGPAISAACAEYLISNYPSLAAVAVDFVSIGSFSDDADGQAAHRALLGGQKGHFICAIEDVNMSSLNPRTIVKVFALPLLIEGIDSAPVTMIAEID